MDKLRKAWAACETAEDNYYCAVVGTDVPAREQEAAHVAQMRAQEAVLRAVGELLDEAPPEAPPANLKEVFERYAIDPKTRPPGGGMPLGQCLARMWRDDMHAFLKLETETNMGTLDTHPEEQDEV